MLFTIKGRSVSFDSLSAPQKETIQSKVKPTVCSKCKGRGKYRTYIAPPDFEEEDWTSWLKKLRKKTELVSCGMCEGTGMEGCKFVQFESIKHETEKAILFVINKKEIWIAKSLIFLKDANVIVVPRWTQLLTTEEWKQHRMWAYEEFHSDMEWGFDNFEQQF